LSKDPTIQLLKWYAIGFVLFIVLICLLSSCEVLKTKRRVATDSISVTKIDSTILKKLEALNKRDCTYYKETILFGRDTTINNFTTPVNNYYPTQVIRESGTFSREDYLRITDSMNRVKSDTTSVSKVEESKSKEIKVLGFWQILAIAAGVGFVFFILGKLKIGFK
jgi:hypothetical protein